MKEDGHGKTDSGTEKDMPTEAGIGDSDKIQENASQTAAKSGPAIFRPSTTAKGDALDESGAADNGEDSGNGGIAEESGNAAPLTSEEKIAELEAKLAEANDNYLRKAADFENFRKRMNQEKTTAIDYANQALLLDLCTVIDDLERAIKSAESQKEAAGNDNERLAALSNSLYEGITMIEKNLVVQLENKWGLKRFDSAGEPFDHNRHEAIMMEKSAEPEEPVVVEEFIKGYTLKDRVIRPAKVKVVMPDKKT